MPGKITDLAALTGAAAATTDLIEAVDVSDTSMAATGTNKKMSLADLTTFVGANVTPPAAVGTKMTDLTALTGAGAAGTDILEVVDISDTTMHSSGTNKKITLTELIVALSTLGITVADNAVTQAKMADGSVGTAEIIDANVTTAKIETGSTTTNGVTNLKLAQMPGFTLKGNNISSATGPLDLTVNQTLTLLGAGGSGNLQRFTFSTATSGAPAANVLRFNNATLGSVTQIAVHYTSIDATDTRTRLLQRTLGDRIYVQDKDASGNYAIFRLTAAPTDVTTYATMAVVYESGAGTIANNQDVLAGIINESKLVPINTQTGTTYTAAATDIYKLITLNNASAITFNLPANSTTPFPLGTTIDLVQLGAGQVTVASPGTPTVNATPSRLFRAQYSAATLLKYATDTWLLVGDLA